MKTPYPTPASVLISFPVLCCSLCVLTSAAAVLFPNAAHAAGEEIKPAQPSADSEKARVSAVDPRQSWPLFRGDSQMTGVSPFALEAPLELAWSKKLGEDLVASAVIEGDRIYIGTGDGPFLCLDLASGNEVWKAPNEEGFEGTAAISGGLVLVGARDGNLYAFDKMTGKERWFYGTDAEILGGVNIAKCKISPESKLSGKTVAVVGSYDNFVHCVDVETGKMVWKYETENYVNGTPTIDGGKVCFGGCDATIYSLDLETGKKLQSVETEAQIANTLAVSGGIAYNGNYGNCVLAVDLNTGKTVWEYRNRNFPFFGSPAVTADRVIVGGRDKRLHCIDRKTGKGVWEFKARGKVDSSPVVSGKTVYVGSNDGRIYAVSLESGEELWSFELGGEVTSSAAIASGMLVIGDLEGTLHAFRTKK